MRSVVSLCLFDSDDAVNGFEEIVHVIGRSAAVDAPGILDGFQVFLGPLHEQSRQRGQRRSEFFPQAVRWQQGKMEGRFLQFVGYIVGGLKQLPDCFRVIGLLGKLAGADNEFVRPVLPFLGALADPFKAGDCLGLDEARSPSRILVAISTASAA